MSAEITEIRLSTNDITQVTIDTDITVLTAAPATINAASLSYSNSAPANIARSASVGSAITVSRSDHVHSAADLLLDGGNY